MKHKHAKLIHAWADGAEIQVKYTCGPDHWEDKDQPLWLPEAQYRIKPEPKPEPKPNNILYVNAYYSTYEYFETNQWLTPHLTANLKLIFDGETSDLKSAEVVK